MRGRLSALLIASEPHAMEILASAIRSRFDNIHLETATNATEALRVLRSNHFDVVVCDLFLDYGERVSFISDMCTLIHADREVIVITADTDITKEAFHSSIKSHCIRNVIHKPVNLRHLMVEIEKALLEARMRKSDVELRS